MSHPGLLIHLRFIQEVQLEYGTQHIRLASLRSILRLTEHRDNYHLLISLRETEKKQGDQQRASLSYTGKFYEDNTV